MTYYCKVSKEEHFNKVKVGRPYANVKHHASEKNNKKKDNLSIKGCLINTSIPCVCVSIYMHMCVSGLQSPGHSMSQSAGVTCDRN